MKYLWIIGGGQLQVPVIKEAHKMGYKTIISDMNPDCICAKLADMFVHLDIYDIEGHIKYVKLLSSVYEIDDVVGVIACGIDAPETASWIAKTLGLPAADPEVARICHNKGEFRKAMKLLDYPVPKFGIIDKDEIEKISKNPLHINSLPVIVKNTDNSGSRGTTIFHNYLWTYKELHEAIKKAQKASKSGKAIVEELFYGTEHTVETLFDIYGNFYSCFITDRFFDYSGGYAVETGLRHPTTLPAYLQRKIYKITEELGRDLGVNASPFKLDIMVTDDGVRVLEATTRLSGGFDCQYLVPLATGKNIIKAGILIATGYASVDWLLKDELGLVGLTGSLFPPQGKIVKIDDTEARKVEGVKEIFWRYRVGDIIEEYIDSTKRVNFIICVGKTEDEARMSLEEAKNKIILEVQQCQQ